MLEKDGYGAIMKELNKRGLEVGFIRDKHADGVFGLSPLGSKRIAKSVTYCISYNVEGGVVKVGAAYHLYPDKYNKRYSQAKAMQKVLRELMGRKCNGGFMPIRSERDILMKPIDARAEFFKQLNEERC